MLPVALSRRERRIFNLPPPGTATPPLKVKKKRYKYDNKKNIEENKPSKQTYHKRKKKLQNSSKVNYGTKRGLYLSNIYYISPSSPPPPKKMIHPKKYAR